MDALLDTIIYFFRDSISGIRYFIYAFVGIVLIFAIVGYMYKQKYTKFASVKINVSGSTPQKEEKPVVPKTKKQLAKEKKAGTEVIKNKTREETQAKKNKKKGKGATTLKNDIPTSASEEAELIDIERQNTQKIPDVK